MSNWIEKDEGFVPLKKFRNLDLDYIRIYPKNNVLMGKTRRQHKEVDGIQISIQKTYWLKMSIGFNHYITPNKDISVFHLHDYNAESLLTLLSLLPDSLILNYYPKNQSTNMKNWSITQENLFIKGNRFNKNGKIIKSNSISINGYIHKDGKTDLASYDNYEKTIPVTV